MLEAEGYTVYTHTKGEWKVVTPKGDTIPFKRHIELSAGMTYIDLREHKERLVTTGTVHNNMVGFTPHEIEKARLSRQTWG